MGIKKIDFYVGALLANLVNGHIAPAIIDTSETSKQLTFDTDNGKYNLFVKYRGTPVPSNTKYDKWIVNFTTNEFNYVNIFHKENYRNYVVLICTNKALNHTESAIIKVDDALKIMGDDSINTTKQIFVKVYKGSKHLDVYGTALSEENAIRIKRNLAYHFQ